MTASFDGCKKFTFPANIPEDILRKKIYFTLYKTFSYAYRVKHYIIIYLEKKQLRKKIIYTFAA